jgi:hypothetical protein
MSHCQETTYRKHTFFSAAAMAFSTVAVALIASCTAAVLYGMHLAAQDPDKFRSFAQEALGWVPALKTVLPPSLIDVPIHCRQPDYCSRIEIAAESKLTAGSQASARTVVRIVNNGNETVSMLLLRIVLLNSRREVLAESTEWAATPVAAQPQWRGPLLPGCQRYIAVSPVPVLSAASLGKLRTEVEIADVRILPSQTQTWFADSRSAAMKR